MALSVIDILVRAKNQASRELNQVTKQLNGLDKATKIAVGGLSALAGGYALQQAGRFALEMAQLNTQLERSAFAFEHFSGGAAQAEANLRAVQRASGGMLTTFEAQNLAVTAMTQGLASTSFELERVTKVARGIVAVSPVINDMETAFSQLALTIANQSTARLDQLGTSAGELRPQIEKLKTANEGMSDAMAFQIALMDTLESKYDPLMEAAVNSASGVERLTSALREQREELAKHFGWLDGLAAGYADLLQNRMDFSKAMELMSNPPMDASPQQLNILGQMAGVIKAANDGQIAVEDAELRIRYLMDAYYALADAAVQAGQAEAAAANAAAAEQDKALAAHKAKIADYNAQIEQAGQRAFQDVYSATGNAAVAMMAYEQTISGIKNAMRDLPDNFRNVEDSLMILPAVVTRVTSEIGERFKFGGEAAAAMRDPVEVLTGAMDRLGYAVSTAAGRLPILDRAMMNSGATALNVAGAIDAAFSKMSDIAGMRSGAKFGGLSDLIKTPMAMGDGMKAIALEAGPAASGVGKVNQAFEDLKSTVSGIVSGAIGPVAGVDANDLLPRPDAINENARRLADIAVNGIKGQSWLEEFKNEVPGVWEEIANSDDPKQAAAKILKDFQDGLRPELLDKQTAKDLVKRALQGDANTKQLVDEIAGELASELGISLSDAKAKASEVLGGDMGGGVTGVSLAPTIDASAAASAASTFASAFTSAIEGGSLGADLSGAIYTQITASVAMIETTGKEAGNTFVKGFTTTFDNIPAAFIAAIAGLVTPIVQANITNNGGRTGAAAT